VWSIAFIPIVLIVPPTELQWPANSGFRVLGAYFWSCNSCVRALITRNVLLMARFSLFSQITDFKISTTKHTAIVNQLWMPFGHVFDNASSFAVHLRQQFLSYRRGLRSPRLKAMNQELTHEIQNTVSTEELHSIPFPLQKCLYREMRLQRASRASRILENKKKLFFPAWKALSIWPVPVRL
jgi:hypothetical protein